MSPKNTLLVVFFSFLNITTKAQDWQLVGERWLSDEKTAYSTIVIHADGTPYLAYQDNANGKRLTVLKYVDHSWIAVGPKGFSTGTAAVISLAITPSGTPYVLFEENRGGATVMKYNGNDWVTVGTSNMVPNGVDHAKLCFDRDETPYIGVSGPGSYIKKYDGSDWVDVLGTGVDSIILSGFFTIAFGPDNMLYMALTGESASSSPTHYGICVLKFDGTLWSLVGERWFDELGSAGGSSMPYALALAFAPDGKPYVLFSDGSLGGRATVMKFDGTSWQVVGNRVFSCLAIYEPCILIGSSEIPYVAYYDRCNEAATVKEFNGSNWVSVGSAPISDDGKVSFVSLAMSGAGSLYVAYDDYLGPASSSIVKAPVTVKRFGWPDKANNIVGSECKFTISPNPGNGQFYFHFHSPDQEQAHIVITNSLGVQVREILSPTNTDLRLQLDEPPGLYFVTATISKTTYTSKIIVQ